MKALLNALQEGRLIELPDEDKERSLEYLAHLIEAVPDLGTAPELAEAMIARERSMNTGIGLGVACPHVRSSGSGELTCAVGWSPAGIEYGSPDGKKVHLVVMYYIPDAMKNVYLKEISSLAGAIRKSGGIAPIAAAEDIATVRERLLDWVQAAIDASVPEAKARMIRLEAKQAVIEAGPSAGPGQLELIPVLVLAEDGRSLVLCQNAALAAALEGDPALAVHLKQKAQFEHAGFKLVCRSSTAYDKGRVLYDYLAVKLV